MVCVTAILRRALTALTLVALPFGAAWAQEGAQPAPATPSAADRSQATEALGAARDALRAALEGGETPHPDQPSWRGAYDAAETAVAAAREVGDQALLREALLVAARGYGLMGWHARAFASYDEYFAEGGELPGAPPAPEGVPPDAELFAAAANALAYARYEAGDHETATAYYLTVLELAPDDQEALRWLARIAFERGDLEGAEVSARLWERLLEVAPDDATARYYRDRALQRTRFGVAASDSFHAGIAAYEAGDLEGALQSFQAALTANPDFVEAEVWSGRVALELGLPQLAAEHWRRVVEARPDDGGAAYFLAVAETQAAYGVRAGSLYFEGLSAYEAGDLETAAERFVAAANANPAFVDAWVWAARSLQEGGRAAESVPYWERVLELEPGDERAAWFLRRARLATERGDVAGPAYFGALSASEAGDAERARRLLEEAVAAEPDFAEAWGFLGRVAFQQGRYEAASEAYGRAAALAPGVTEYAFFAEEAARLAGVGREDDDGPGAAETEPPAPGQPQGDEPPEAEPDGDAPDADGSEGAGPDEDEPDDAPSEGETPAEEPEDEPEDVPGGGPVQPLPPD